MMQTMQQRILDRLVTYAQKIGLTVTHTPDYANTGAVLLHPTAKSFEVIGRLSYDFQTNYATIRLRLLTDGSEVPRERNWACTQYDDHLERELQTIELAILALNKEN